MHKEILTKEQAELFPLLKHFSKKFGLAGGTAIALYIGHRRSVDFDLFSNKGFSNIALQKEVSRFFKIQKVFVNKLDEYTIMVNGVRVTFFRYPYRIRFNKKFGGIIALPDLLTLAAMKAFALGMRAKWKDYVDLYFITKNRFSLEEIVKESKKVFGKEFNEKIFRAQLSYFKDIDYKEEVVYLKGFAVSGKAVQKELVSVSLSQ